MSGHRRIQLWLSSAPSCSGLLTCLNRCPPAHFHDALLQIWHCSIMERLHSPSSGASSSPHPFPA
eukprot:954944-Pelagomonas_calceolata.AAC.1